MDEQREETDEAPAFGPRGYLPDRASRRARKIVLRAPMGLQWIIGAVAVGVVVAVAGWFALRDTTPAEPFVAVPVALVEAADGVAMWDPAGAEEPVLVVTSGRTRVLRWPGTGEPVLCEESGLLEAGDGDAWRVTGRGVGGTTSLAAHPVVVDDGVLYVDPTSVLDPPEPDPDPAATRCTP